MRYINERTYIAYCMALLVVLFLSSVVPVRADSTTGALIPIIVDIMKKDQQRATPVCTDYRGCADNNPFSGASSFVVELGKEFPTEAQPPVEYTDFDMSAYLDGWYVMYGYQLKLDEILDDEDRIADFRKADLARKAYRDNMEFSAYVLLLIIAGFGVITYLHTRKV